MGQALSVPVVVDLFPPGPRDPHGLPKAIWDEFTDNDFRLSADKPLSAAAFSGGPFPEAFIEPLAVDSMCALLRDHKARGTSLGFFRPKVVESFGWETVPGPAGTRGGDAPSYRFRYVYRCEDPSCPGHSQLIVDWDLQENLRSWTARFGNEQVALEHVRMLWFDQMCAPDRDTHFFAGNVAKLPHSFLILGVFWPRKS